MKRFNIHINFHDIILLVSILTFIGCSEMEDPIHNIEDNICKEFIDKQNISGISITKDSLLKIQLPLVFIDTKDSIEPTFDKVPTPEGCWGNGISNAIKVPGRMVIIEKRKILFDSKEDGLKIKVRGNTTAYETKKPYKIKLTKEADLLFRGDEKKYKDKNWCLIKDEQLKAKVGFKIGELMGMKWTPQYKYVNLIFNGEFRGLYMLVESIDKNNKCRLYVGNGGSILEYDAYWWNEAYYIKSPTFTYPLHYTFKYPDEDDLTDEDKGYYTELIDYFERSLSEDTWISSLDVTSFVNWIMCHDILGTGDGGGTNMYILKEDRSDNSKVEMPCFWDFGKAFYMKNQWSESHGSGIFAFGPLLKDDIFKLLYKTKWNNIHATIINNLCTFLNDYKLSNEFGAIGLSIQLDNNRWNVDNNNPSVQLDNYSEWFKEREQWITKNIDNL